jgi:hypothetical protein
VAGHAVARDQTPPPLLSVSALSATSLQVSVYNRGPYSEDGSFTPWKYDVWINQYVNGVSSSDFVNSQLSDQFGRGHELSVGEQENRTYSITVDKLTPDTTYCYIAKFAQYAKRVDLDNLTSDYSDKVCATTSKPPQTPLPPLDINADVDEIVGVPTISWRTPDQSDNREVDSFTIESKRVSHDFTNARYDAEPWVLEKTIRGPAGRQTASTQLDYKIAVSKVEHKTNYIYRVCAINSGGSSCNKVLLNRHNSVIKDGISPHKPLMRATGSSTILLSPKHLGKSSAGINANSEIVQSGQGSIRLGGMRTGLGGAKTNHGITQVQSPISGITNTAMTWLGSDEYAIIVVGGRQSSVSQLRQEINSVRSGAPTASHPMLSALCQTPDNHFVTIGLRRISAGEIKHDLRNICVPSPPPIAPALSHSLAPGKTVQLNPQPLPRRSEKVQLNPQPLPPRAGSDLPITAKITDANHARVRSETDQTNQMRLH